MKMSNPPEYWLDLAYPSAANSKLNCSSGPYKPARAGSDKQWPTSMTTANGLTRALRSALFGLVGTRDGRGDPAPRSERPGHAAVPRRTGAHEIVEDPVGGRLVVDPLVAERLQVHLERLELHARPVGGVGERNGAKVRLAGDGADAGELGADDLDGIVATGGRIGKGL